MKFVKEISFMLVVTTCCTLLMFFLDRNPYLKSMRARKSRSNIVQLAGFSEQTLEKFDESFHTFRVPGLSGEFVRLTGTELHFREEQGAGMWGIIRILLGYDLGSGQITGLKIIEHSETPGIGSRISEPVFTSQFKGLKTTSSVRLSNLRVRENDFDGITGATVSSLAIEKIVSNAVRSVIRAAGNDQTREEVSR